MFARAGRRRLLNALRTLQSRRCTTSAARSRLPTAGMDGWAWGMALDGEGGGTLLNEWDPIALSLIMENPLGGAIADLMPEPEPVPSFARGGCWVHLDFSKAESVAWLHSTELWSSSMSDRGAHRLALRRLTTLSSSDQPRFLVQRWGDKPSAAASAINILLRSLHFDPATRSSDAVVLRLRLSSRVLLSARHENLVGLSQHPELRTDLLRGAGAGSPGGLLAEIVEIIVERCAPAVGALDEDLFALRDKLQRFKSRESVSAAELAGLRRSLAPLRQQVCLDLRRHRAYASSFFSVAPPQALVHAHGPPKKWTSYSV